MNTYFRDAIKIKDLSTKPGKTVSLVKAKNSIPDYPEVFLLQKFQTDEKPVEIETHKALKDSNETLLQLYDEWLDGKVFCMATEYCEHGSLHNWQQELSEKSLNMQFALNSAKQLSQAVSIMHSKKICHRNIKPQSIFFNNNKSFFKLGNFSQAKYVENSELNHHTIRGDLEYMSPEQMENYGFRSGLKVNPYRDDIWALGRIFIEISLGRKCDEILGMSTVKLHQFIKNEFSNLQYPLEYINLVEEMMTDLPDSFKTSEQITKDLISICSNSVIGVHTPENENSKLEEEKIEKKQKKKKKIKTIETERSYCSNRICPEKILNSECDYSNKDFIGTDKEDSKTSVTINSTRCALCRKDCFKNCTESPCGHFFS